MAIFSKAESEDKFHISDLNCFPALVLFILTSTRHRIARFLDNHPLGMKGEKNQHKFRDILLFLLSKWAYFVPKTALLNRQITFFLKHKQGRRKRCTQCYTTTPLHLLVPVTQDPYKRAPSLKNTYKLSLLSSLHLTSHRWWMPILNSPPTLTCISEVLLAALTSSFSLARI